MNTTQRIIRHLAIVLILAFPTLVTCAPAVAACKGMGHATPMLHTCCLVHPTACACQNTHHAGARHFASTGGYADDCSCAITPSPERAPAIPSSSDVYVPLILVSTSQIGMPTPIRSSLQVSYAEQTSQCVALASSSPRAPPFQG